MNTHQDRWQRIKERLRFELGEDVFTSWFGHMEFESVDKGVLRLSVPTVFLRKWIQAHYTDRILAQWQVEDPTISRLELSVRSPAIRLVSKPKPAAPSALARQVPAQNSELSTNGPFVSMKDTLGGSPLDPRLTFETFIIGRSNTLAHAAAKQIATSGRGDQLMFNPPSTSTARWGSAKPTCCKRLPRPATTAIAKCSI
jgi:chromosomal replication initiator protein